MARIRKQQKNADAGRVLVDEQLESLEKDISRLYANASKEMKDKSEAFLDDYWQKDKKMRARLEAGEITEDQLKSWRKGQASQMEKMSAQVADLTQTMLNADKTAMAMVGDKLPDVYATSYNYAGYRGERYAQATGRDYTSFTIYNRDAVRKLIKDDPDLLPQVDIPKDERWNRKHIQNAIAQGIIQGEPVSDISRRLMAVTTMDENAALRNARTSVNGIENKARFDATEQLKADGIPMVYTWSATHDGRTRASHILLDGQQPDESGYFENGLRYPADPDGDPAEVYNCRCALLTQIEGIDHSKDDELYDQFMQESDYESWLAMKENPNQQAKEQAFQKNKEKALAKRAEVRKEASEQETGKQEEYRGHINSKDKYWRYNDDGGMQLTNKGVSLIVEELGVDDAEAKELGQAVLDFSQSGYRKVRKAENGNADEETQKYINNLETYIDKAPKWDGGEISRGIAVDKNEVDSLIDKVENNQPINLMGTNSWTSKRSTAEGFSTSYSSDQMSVVMVNEANSTKFGTSTKHLSQFKAENEVLVSGKADFVPTRYEYDKGKLIIYGNLEKKR